MKMVNLCKLFQTLIGTRVLVMVLREISLNICLVIPTFSWAASSVLLNRKAIEVCLTEMEIVCFFSTTRLEMSGVFLATGFIRNVVIGEHFRFISIWPTRASYLASLFVMIVFVSKLQPYCSSNLFLHL